jgi:uncharacterized protein YvpB
MKKFSFFGVIFFVNLCVFSLDCFANDYKLELKPYRQKYDFSCEAAALTVILNYENIPILEDQVIKSIPIDLTPRTTSVWGDPANGFVGDIYGKNANVSYGIHWQGLKKVAQRWGRVEAGNAKDSSILIAHLLKKKPVIVWVISETASGRDLTWKTPSGKIVKAIEGEHTVVVYGFQGDPIKPDGFYILDPAVGLVFRAKLEFEKNWTRLGNSYLVMVKAR